MKKALTTLLALTLFFSLSVSALAAAPTDISIENINGVQLYIRLNDQFVGIRG